VNEIIRRNQIRIARQWCQTSSPDYLIPHEQARSVYTRQVIPMNLQV
jgi:hypothetical protein